jgi:formylglycine-generating enzyme required for sulfatase activity
LTERGKRIVALQDPDPGRAVPEVAAPAPSLPHPRYLPVTERIREQIITGNAEPLAMAAYTERVPLSGDAKFKMIPVPGGTFTIGTPNNEPGHRPDEAPRVEIEISPFWIGECEVTWELYRAFMENGAARNKDGTLDRDSDPMTSEPPETDDNAELVDAVSQPTPPYTPMHFEMGQGYGPGWPAIAMTQHAASKFCEWLSAQTGNYYRLPTEAEWEYACRAGTTTAYSFGEDPAKLDEHAWTIDNCGFTYQKVGQKKPNGWGIHDMHGNVAEWCLDAYLPDAYTHWQDGTINPWHPAEKRYPRVARGGSYDDENPAETMRSGARIKSDPAWKALDPQNPKSIWYHTSNQWIGFRVIRPLEVPDLETMHLMWNTGPGE